MKHSDLKVWKFCPTSSCLSSQDPLFGEKLVLCVATSATILPKTMLWKCGFQNCKKCLLFEFQQLHTSYLFQCSPQTAPSPLYYTRWVFLRSTAQATHPGPVLTSPAFQVSAEIANCGQNGWTDPKYPILWCGSSNYFGFSPVCANSDKCCRNGVRYIFLILSFICSILSFVGTQLLGEGWTLQQVQLKQFVL